MYTDDRLLLVELRDIAERLEVAAADFAKDASRVPGLPAVSLAFEDLECAHELADTLPPSPLRNKVRGKRALGAFATIAALAIGGVVIARAAVNTRPQVVTTGRTRPYTEPYLLRPTYLPNGLCLAEVTADSYPDPNSIDVVFRRGSKLLALRGEVSTRGFAGAVGRTVDFGGKQALLRRIGGTSVLAWNGDDGSMRLSSVDLDDAELIAAARSLVVKRVITSREPSYGGLSVARPPSGFTQDADSIARLRSASKRLWFLPCRKTESRRSVSISTASAMTLALDRAINTDPVPSAERAIRRHGAKVVSSFVSHGDQSFTYKWEENGALVTVTASGIAEREVVRLIDRLGISTVAQMDALASTASQALTRNGVSLMFSEKTIDARTADGVAFSYALEVQGNALALSLRSVAPKASVTVAAFASGVIAADRPTVPRLGYMSVIDNDVRAGATFAPSSMVRAEAVMPDGTRRELFSAADPKAASWRVFIWAQRKMDPWAVAIRYYNARGALVYEQT